MDLASTLPYSNKDSPLISNSKITFLIPSLLLGGAELQTIYQANELVSRGYPVQIIVLSEKIPLISHIDNKVLVTVIHGHGMDKVGYGLILNLFFFRLKIIKALNDSMPTHIIASLGSAHFIIRTFSKSLKDNPKIWIYHHSTEYTQSPVNTIPKKLFHTWNKWKGSKSDHGHLYISKAVQQNIESHYPAKNGHIIHNAIPTQVIPDAIVIKMTSKFHVGLKQYIIIPGRLHKVKGHAFFLESLHQFLNDHQIRVVFAGYGPA